MEARKITIVSTKTQKKSVIMSEATTLSELKADLRQNGIDYDGMTFYEGTSKVELKDDNSVLPHDVPYKGIVTNELIFMLTNTNKKIKSGASRTRAELYSMIKTLGLQAECVKRFGKNFTMCKTIDLDTLVNSSVESTKNNKTKPNSVVNEEKKNDSVNNIELEKPNEVECVDTKLRTAFIKLLDILYDNDCISHSEMCAVKDIFHKEENNKCASPYSEAEIDEMFTFTK